MVDLIEQGARRLAAIRKANAGRIVTYCRDSASVTIRASLGQSTFALVTGDGPAIEVTRRDYFISPADLVLDGKAVTPAVGDKVQESDPDTGVVRTYEVCGPGGDSPAWRYTDRYNTDFRVHTVEAGSRA